MAQRRKECPVYLYRSIVPNKNGWMYLCRHDVSQDSSSSSSSSLSWLQTPFVVQHKTHYRLTEFLGPYISTCISIHFHICISVHLQRCIHCEYFSVPAVFVHPGKKVPIHTWSVSIGRINIFWSTLAAISYRYRGVGGDVSPCVALKNDWIGGFRRSDCEFGFTAF